MTNGVLVYIALGAAAVVVGLALFSDGNRKTPEPVESFAPAAQTAPHAPDDPWADVG